MPTLDINSSLEINKRLVKVFSVSALKEVFNLNEYKERQAELVERIIETYSVAIINQTVFNNFSLLKQHVYLFDFLGTIADSWLDNHPYFHSKNKISNSHSIYNLLFPVTIEFFNKTTRNIQNIEFIIPVQINKKNTKLIIHINILERDVSTIIGDKVISTTRDFNDDTILNSIVQSANPARLTKSDLNRGIKKLWEDDEVDAFKVKFKKSKSTSMEVMDEDKLLKKDIPTVYNELIRNPLIQTTFKVLKRNNLLNYFVVDPTKGVFYFSIYPQHHNGINDLIDLVLTNN
jgi:hypothetical protein